MLALLHAGLLRVLPGNAWSETPKRFKLEMPRPHRYERDFQAIRLNNWRYRIVKVHVGNIPEYSDPSITWTLKLQEKPSHDDDLRIPGRALGGPQGGPL